MSDGRRIALSYNVVMRRSMPEGRICELIVNSDAGFDWKGRLNKHLQNITT